MQTVPRRRNQLHFGASAHWCQRAAIRNGEHDSTGATQGGGCLARLLVLRRRRSGRSCSRALARTV